VKHPDRSLFPNVFADGIFSGSVHFVGRIIIDDSDSDTFIYVKSEKKNVKILLKEILFIEGLKDYIKIPVDKRGIFSGLCSYPTTGIVCRKISAILLGYLSGIKV
jgi:hypothetical protein